MELERILSLANHRYFMAKENLEACNDNFEKSRYNKSVDDIYYACYNLCRACMIINQEKDYSDHGKCIGEFNKYFVNEKQEIAKVTGSALHTLARERNKKTYKEEVPVSKEEAEELVNLGRNVYEELEKLLNKNLKKLNNDFS